MQIPSYLKDITKNVQEKSTMVEAEIVCNCGNTYFYIFENEISTEDKSNIERYEKIISKYNEFYRDPTSSILYMVHRNIFGKITSRIEAEKLPKINTTKAVKIKCSKCDKEYVIFDNRVHGYNAILNPTNNIKELQFKQKKFNYSLSSLASIKIKLRNEIGYEEFKDETSITSFEDFSNSFSSIVIQGSLVDANKKSILILSEETD